MGVKKPRAFVTPRVEIGKLESWATLWLAEEVVKKGEFQTANGSRYRSVFAKSNHRENHA